MSAKKNQMVICRCLIQRSPLFLEAVNEHYHGNVGINRKTCNIECGQKRRSLLVRTKFMKIEY